MHPEWHDFNNERTELHTKRDSVMQDGTKQTLKSSHELTSNFILKYFHKTRMATTYIYTVDLKY